MDLDAVEQAEFQELIQAVRVNTERQVKDVRDIQDAFTRRAAQIEAMASEIDSKIRELNRRIEEARSQGAQPASADEHAATANRLQEGHQSSIDQIRACRDSLKSVTTRVKEEISALQEEERDILEKRAALETKAQQAVPHLRRKLDVYALISRIEWDGLEHESTSLKGVVKGSHGVPAVRVDLDPAAESNWSIADKLWDAI